MSIQKEKELVGIGDRTLFRRMLAYAKPYWKMFLLCLVLAFLIVGADLARTYLVKVAIDDHINGLGKPMIAMDEAGRDLLAEYGEVMVDGDTAYVRVSADWHEPLPDGARKVQILTVDDQYVMIGGWLTGSRDDLSLKETEAGPVLEANGRSYPAERLDKEAVRLFREKDSHGLLVLGLIFLVVVFGGAALNYVQSNLLQYTGQSIIFNIRKELFEHLSRMSMKFYDRNPSGRLVTRVTSDTESLNQLYTQVLVNMVKDVLMIIGVVVVMMQLSLELSLLAFAVLPVLAVITFWYRNIARKAQRMARLYLSRLNAFLAENLSGMRITQLFTREEKQKELFDELNDGHYRAGMKGTVVNSIFQPAIGFLGNLAIALLIWYGGLRVLEGAVSFGIVYAFTQYINQFFQPLKSIADKYNQIQTAMVGAERIVDMLNEQPDIVDPANPKHLPEKVRGEIVFENVWFAYNDDDWVLKDISFTIQPGQTVAFVGATGAGKSSIIQLINRFYDIQKGSIKLDGIDIREIPLAELRRTIAVVQQDVFLFSGDIKYNIRLNNNEITDEQIREAAKMVYIDRFVEKLPNGYETELGERGINLSMGERQLLSFARAIVFQPQILILDEATSNIDTETETYVQNALLNISKGRTTLIVAHRLSTIQHADQIIVMHKGRVQEIGNHQQLLEKKGYYYRLYQMQFKEQHEQRGSLALAGG